jgi:hypothetical protein
MNGPSVMLRGKLTSVPSFSGASHSCVWSPRVATHSSTLPPRSEAKYNLLPSGDSAGENSAPELLLLRWNVSAPFGEMFERLRSLSVWYGEEEAIDDETGPDGVPRLLMSWYEPPPPPQPEDRRGLGFLYLDDGRLAADVATRAIAECLMGEINARLGSAATLVETRSSLPVRIHSRSDSLPPVPRAASETRDSEGR